MTWFCLDTKSLCVWLRINILHMNSLKTNVVNCRIIFIFNFMIILRKYKTIISLSVRWTDGWWHTLFLRALLFLRFYYLDCVIVGERLGTGFTMSFISTLISWICVRNGILEWGWGWGRICGNDGWNEIEWKHFRPGNGKENRMVRPMPFTTTGFKVKLIPHPVSAHQWTKTTTDILLLQSLLCVYCNIFHDVLSVVQ